MGSGAGLHCMCDEGYTWPSVHEMTSCVAKKAVKTTTGGHMGKGKSKGKGKRKGKGKGNRKREGKGKACPVLRGFRAGNCPKGNKVGGWVCVCV